MNPDSCTVEPLRATRAMYRLDTPAPPATTATRVPSRDICSERIGPRSPRSDVVTTCGSVPEGTRTTSRPSRTVHTSWLGSTHAGGVKDRPVRTGASTPP